MVLTPDTLRTTSRRQVGLLADRFRSLDLDRATAEVVDIPAERRAGFLAIRSPHAGALVRLLRDRGVLADARGDVLRLGPAPYLSDAQLEAAVAIAGEAAMTLPRV